MDVSKKDLPSLIANFFCQIKNCGIKNQREALIKSTLVDNSYSVLKKTDIANMLKSNLLLIGQAESLINSDLFDCDDYALQLKSSLTALFRTQRLLSSNSSIFPPAVGIVITQNHAINIVICESINNKPEVFLIDASLASPKLIDDPLDSARLLKTMPISLIYI